VGIEKGKEKLGIADPRNRLNLAKPMVREQ
jgi:hypothetical protein